MDDFLLWERHWSPIRCDGACASAVLVGCVAAMSALTAGAEMLALPSFAVVVVAGAALLIHRLLR